MKKAIIILTVVLVLLVVITIIIGKFRQTVQQTPTETSITAISLESGTNRLSADISSQREEDPKATEDFNKTHRAVTTTDIIKLNSMKPELPYEESAFTIDVASPEGTLIITKNEPKAESRIDDYLRKKGVGGINYKDATSSIFEFIDRSDDQFFEDQQQKDEDLEFTTEEKEEIVKEFGPLKQSDIKKREDLKILRDLMRTLLEFDEDVNIGDTNQGLPAPISPPSLSTSLLPNPPPEDLSIIRNFGQPVLRYLRSHPELVSAYKAASTTTSLPWQLFAAIHYREGLRADTSLVSGRKIGTYEPDAGRTFRSVRETAEYAARLFKRKARGRPIDDFQTLVGAVSRYNGGGNRNCGRGTTYTACPRQFYGEDDPYALNLFDTKHQKMYIIFCRDHMICPIRDRRPGVITMFKYLIKNTP